ncbi:hypothetical protein A6R68_22131, partial [Neotoma lepida]
ILYIHNNLCQATTGKTAPHLAVETQEQNIVQFLIQAGAQVDDPMMNGCTPVHLTASLGLNSIPSTLWETGPETLQLNMEDDAPYDLDENAKATHGICGKVAIVGAEEGMETRQEVFGTSMASLAAGAWLQKELKEHAFSIRLPIYAQAWISVGGFSTEMIYRRELSGFNGPC